MDEYWVVDPRARSVTIFTRDGSRFTAERAFVAGSIVSCVLPDLRIDVEALFGDLPPSRADSR